ncbi:hypothetical protein ACFYNM_01770 [Streptomyces spororaveus]|uniref:hypothetical protein n=1 Tax=Streptomyces spororaveus TaxID=284039 RepID=UPI0036889B31
MMVVPDVGACQALGCDGPVRGLLASLAMSISSLAEPTRRTGVGVPPIQRGTVTLRRHSGRGRGPYRRNPVRPLVARARTSADLPGPPAYAAADRDRAGHPTLYIVAAASGHAPTLVPARVFFGPAAFLGYRCRRRYLRRSAPGAAVGGCG